MSNVSASNIGGCEHADHMQIDDHDDGRVLCICGVIFTAITDHTGHEQIDDFDSNLTICSCGTNWTLGAVNE